VAVLPRVDSGSQVIDYVAGVHPDLIARRPKDFLRRPRSWYQQGAGLSKGMVAQLHLAIVNGELTRDCGVG